MLAREAYDSVCARVAQIYEQDGWKYSKSSHWMTKKTKNFTYQVRFYTSYYNISEKDVAFYGSFGVSMNKPKQGICGLSTQDSGVPHGRLEWNVAKEEMWEDSIKEFTHWLETECFPIMHELENNLEEFVEKVTRQGFYPPLGYSISIPFMLQYGTEEQRHELNLYAGNHIGFFVAWLIKHDYLSDKHKDCEGVQRVKAETMTGTEFLLEYCGGELWTDDIVDSMGWFAWRYCNRSYFRDYIGWVLDELCDIPMEFIGNWEDYHSFEPVLDKAYETF